MRILIRSLCFVFACTFLSQAQSSPDGVRNVTATESYLIFQSVYTYKEKGVPMREAVRMAIALRQEGGAWKVDRDLDRYRPEGGAVGGQHPLKMGSV